MSDLRTELFTKVLPKMQSLTKPTELNNLSFDDPEQPVTPVAEEVSNNERIFNWVKDHPAQRTNQIAKAFDGSILKQSVATQLYVMTARGLLHKAICSTTGKYIYSTAVDVYPRADKAAIFAKMKAGREAIGKEELVRRIQAGYNAKKTEPKKKIVLVKKETPAPAPAVQVTPVDLNTLSIVQARKLYDELKQIFGA